ncbi:MAG: response regulator [Verrucomicrobiota bacterium]
MSQILVLDDEENYALMLRALLNEHGFAVDIATSANDAYRMIRDRQYTLIVSDYRMPLMDGAAFLKKVRQIHPRLPVFLVSGVMDTAELVKVANLGATRVYEKPLDTDMFLGQVRCFVEPDTESSQKSEDPFHKLKSLYLDSANPSYQSPLQFLPDHTPIAKRWIEKLSAAWTRNDALLLSNPEGGEAHLALQECACWEGLGRQVLEPISLREFTETDVRPVLDQAIQDHRHILVVISEFEDVDEEHAFDALAFLFESAPQIFGSEGAVRFAFVAKNRLANCDGLSHVQKIFRASIIQVPKLRGRFSDIVFLLCNNSEQWLPQGLWPQNYSPEVCSRLLAYDWPGNFEEIVTWLHFLGDQRPTEINIHFLNKFLAKHQKTCSDLFSLEDALTAAQQQLIMDTASVTESRPLELLGIMGFDVDSLPEGTTIEDFEFLFPSVLEDVGSG